MPADSPARYPQRLVCTPGTTRFWPGAAVLAIGVASGVIIAGMAHYMDGFGEASRGTLLVGAGVTAASDAAPSAFLQLVANVTFDTSPGVQREATRLVAERGE